MVSLHGIFLMPFYNKKNDIANIWDSLATRVLERSPSLQQILEEKKDSDSNFRNNSAAQLDFIYKNSPYYERAHLRYPVYRIERGL